MEDSQPSEVPFPVDADKMVFLLNKIYEFLARVTHRNPADKGLQESETFDPKKETTQAKKSNSINSVASKVDSLTGLDKRQSAMYMNRQSKLGYMEMVKRNQLGTITEETEEVELLKKEKFLLAQKIHENLRTSEKEFLELDFEIHSILENENEKLLKNFRRSKLKFLKETKYLRKVLEYSKTY